MLDNIELPVNQGLEFCRKGRDVEIPGVFDQRETSTLFIKIR
jgi:hypothetical protein